MTPSDREPLSWAAVLGGVICGVLFMVVGFSLVLLSSTPFENFHPAFPNQEFATSVGQDIYFISLSLGVLVGGIAIFRSNMHAFIRSLCLGFAITLLGFFALCDYFSIFDLISTPHK